MVEITRYLTPSFSYDLREEDEGIVLAIRDGRTDDIVVERLDSSEITRLIRDLAAMMMCSVTLEKL